MHEAVLIGHEADSLIKVLLECGANPNIKNAKNETAHHNDAMNPNKGSPRIGRLRGISPQSREKAYATGSNNNNQQNTTTGNVNPNFN